MLRASKFYMTLVTSIIFVTTISFTISLSTTFCDHNQFQTSLLRSLECWNEYSNAEVKSLSQNRTEELILPGCEDIEKVTSCFVDNIGTCFAQEQNADAILLITFAFSNYVNETRCDRNAGVVKSIIENNFKNMIMKYLEYAKNEEFISSIFTLDHNCTLDELEDSLLPEQICLTRLPLMVQKYIKRINSSLVNMNVTINSSHSLVVKSSNPREQTTIQLKSPAQTVKTNSMLNATSSNASTKYLKRIDFQSFGFTKSSNNTNNQTFNDIESSVITKILNAVENQSFPLCKAIDDTLHCIRPNDCVSMRETNLFKKVLFKIYKIGMEHGTLLIEQLGGLEEFYEALGFKNDSKLQVDPIIPALLQLTSEDFKVDLAKYFQYIASYIALANHFMQS